MDGLVQRNIEDLATGWIEEFDHALKTNDRDALGALFATDSHWRNICGITWSFATISGDAAIADALLARVAEAEACGFELFADRHPPRLNTVADEEVIEAVLQFRTKAGTGIGVVRFKPASAEASGRPIAWSLMTAIEQLDGHDYTPVQDEEDQNHNRSSETGNWLDRRAQERSYDNKEPDVLIVGGGHAGLTSAVELKQLGLDALVVDGMKRVGDNWRLRYHSLKLHNVTSVNHLPYMPFPKTFPRYIPKDKIANWLESYVEHMELNFWTETRFESAAYDENSDRWNAQLRMADGSARNVRPAHIIMATSVSGTPKYPDIPTLDAFDGTVLHSSQLDDGSLWTGKKALVFGTGTSAHDIAQELHANGADVTMVQRSPTMVVNVDPSAQLYDGAYLDLTKRTEDLDLFNSSFPMPIIKANHKLITTRVRAHDKPILDALEAKGFRLEFGEDGTGWPLKYRTRGGGYYFNAGCSDLIADGSIGLVQYHDIAQFEAGGIQMKDGSSKPADLAVLATGYYPPAHDIPGYYGQAVADRVGTVWNVHPETQEINNMWVRTGQPGLWFTGGSFSQCRIYSKYLARQILGVELGLLTKTAPVD
ncbi:MAG: monooxygenase [Rhodospirillaceae bacterium]|nr:monooxygenase [Rhodospirillaceae bacterium]